MNQELQQLEQREKELKNLTQQNETSLYNALEENNSLEAEYLSQSYQKIYNERPIQIRNIFAQVEKDVFQSDFMMNENFLRSSIENFKNEINQIQPEIEQLSSTVESQRHELLQILREIDSVRYHPTNQAYIEKPEETCSKEVEKLAREFAYSIDDVNEDDLIQYLARGKEIQSDQQILQEASQLARNQSKHKQLVLSKKILQRLDQEITNLVNNNNDSDFNGSNNCEKVNLSDAFDSAAESLSQIKSNDSNGDDDSLTEKWTQLQNVADEIKVVRSQLLDAVAADGSVPLPQEFSFPEREKAALKQTLEALTESNRLLAEYLKRLTSQGIVDTRVMPPDEARQIVARFNELKQKLHQ
ncbi:hypothetical protein TRFO_25276 [Tritrichomonas foetus]|uniref:Uncharacterized protein n=1 Tax=Tritrichomonas foetus TaxID=1144522 RepID=A0A1J4K6T6_9EUKA|nr:hypothetical protein TRFO_25276 [Tritrichomonas foetus]|eukprot:OHT06608.1 hypothetical protein TRFO_25276 [Tritrichomonas foetus]